MSRKYETLSEYLQRVKPDVAKALKGLNPRELFDRIRNTITTFALFGSDEKAAEQVSLLFRAVDDLFFIPLIQEDEEMSPHTDVPKVRGARESARTSGSQEAIKLYQNLPRQPLSKTRAALLAEIVRRWGQTRNAEERAALSTFLLSVEELFDGEGEIRIKALRQAVDQKVLTSAEVVTEAYVELASKGGYLAGAKLHNGLVGALGYAVRQTLGLPSLAFRLYLPLLRLSRGPNCRGLRKGVNELACGLMGQVAAQQEAVHELVEVLTNSRGCRLLPVYPESIMVTYPDNPPRLGVVNIRVETQGLGKLDEESWLTERVEPLVRSIDEEWQKAHPDLTVVLTVVGLRSFGSSDYEHERTFRALS
jgi:hypothetical protein